VEIFWPCREVLDFSWPAPGCYHKAFLRERIIIAMFGILISRTLLIDEFATAGVGPSWFFYTYWRILIL